MWSEFYSDLKGNRVNKRNNLEDNKNDFFNFFYILE